MIDDLISRQAAIEKAEMLFKTLSKETVDMMGIGFNHAVADAIAILKNLPSAEPQIVHCAECKWWGDARSIAFPDNHICFLHMCFSTTAIDYCSGGERRTYETD